MKEVSAALVKAQRAFGPALKSSTNPHFKSKYADLAACVEAVIEALNANGIALVQRNVACEEGVCVETVFVHESGETLSSGPLHVPAAKSDPQGYGSALTYARRYSLMAACGIAPEDDDGNAGSAPKTPAQRKPVDPAHEIVEDDPRNFITKDRLAELDEVALMMIENFNGGKQIQTKEIWYSADTWSKVQVDETQERKYVWNFCLGKESKIRTFVKANHPERLAAKALAEKRPDLQTAA